MNSCERKSQEENQEVYYEFLKKLSKLTRIEDKTISIEKLKVVYLIKVRFFMTIF